MGFWDGLAEAMDDIRHKVVEEPAYGKEVTGNIELPQQQEPPIEPTSWQAAAQDIEPQHSDQYFVRQPTQDMER